jgi:hypothetical protein
MRWFCGLDAASSHYLLPGLPRIRLNNAWFIEALRGGKNVLAHAQLVWRKLREWIHIANLRF